MRNSGEVRSVREKAVRTQRRSAAAALACTLLATASGAHAQQSPPPPVSIQSTPTPPVPTGEMPTAVKEPEVMIAPPPAAPPPPTQVLIAPVVIDGQPAVAEVELEEEAEAEPESKWTDIVTFGGYVEAYYGWNFRRPENHVAGNRWVDERHNSFTLQTVGLDLKVEKGAFASQVTLMFGPTADRWYFEGVQPKGGPNDAVLGFGQYSNETWKHVMNAWASYTLPVGKGLTVMGGLMPTQVGFEPTPVKDNWNFSRSNLFNYLPFFHLGARVFYPVTDSWTVTGAVYNGWNQPVELNSGKSISFQSAYLKDKWLFNLLYLGGNEQPYNAPTGKVWRNMFDAVAQYDISERLSLAGEANGGWENGDLGVGGWFGGGAWARLKATNYLYFAARGDGIYEHVASKGGVSSPIFFAGGNHIASGTFTIELRPMDGISFRLEYRHDDMDEKSPQFYKRGFTTLPDGTTVQNAAKVQDTLTLGMTGWF
jgi:Putative beta-barrel porin-2, OmpL-like. bbp2